MSKRMPPFVSNSSKSPSELENEILSLRKDLGAAIEDNEKKAFSIKSLIGQRARLKSLMEVSAAHLNERSSRQFAQMFSLIHQTKSQFFQELFALAFSECRNGGFFVEFGACDGLHLSNSYLLETCFNWSGILAEPSRIWHEGLSRNRRVAIDHRCVWSETGNSVSFSESPFPGESTLSRFGEKNTEYLDEYDVETVSLLDMLKEHNAPNYIEFLSMDTERTEYEILRAFDFSQFQFGFIAVEQYHDEQVGHQVTRLLDDAGYELVFAEDSDLGPWAKVSGFDNWYVPRDRLRFLRENGL